MTFVYVHVQLHMYCDPCIGTGKAGILIQLLPLVTRTVPFLDVKHQELYTLYF